MKKVVSLLLCAVMLIGLLPVSALAANTNELTLKADKTEVTAGDEIKFTVSVELTELSHSFGVILEFDRDIFEFGNGKFDRNFGYDDDDNEIALVKTVQTEVGQEGFAVSFNDKFYPSEYSGKVATFTLKVKEGANFTTATVSGRGSMQPEGCVLNVNTVTITNSNPVVETTAATEPAHVHTWVEHAAVAPTCTTEGNIAYKQCSECGEAWSLDQNPMPLGKFGWVLGVAHNWVEHAAVAPTCTATGNVAYKQCADCGEAWTLGENPVMLSKNGWILGAAHAWVEHEAVAPTCTTEGNVAYKQCSACGEAWTLGENPVMLSKDGWILGVAHNWVEHEAVAPTCDFEGNVAYKQCADCGEAWTLGENPVMLAKDRWVLAPVGHTWVDHAAVEPTCDTDGNIAYQQCSTCGAAQTAGQNPMPLGRYQWVLGALGHTWVDHAAVEPTCTADGNIAYQQCSVCGAAQTAGENPMPLSKFGWVLAAEHKWVEHEAVAPTCDFEGNVAYKQCADCGEAWTLGENPVMLAKDRWVLAPVGHTWTDIAAVAPTCDTEGNIAYQQCSVCGAAQTAGQNPMPLGRYQWVLGALGHTWVDHAAVEPTCYTEGNIAYQQCSVCGAAQTAGENPMPLGKFGWVLGIKHSALVHYEAVEATCETDGHYAFDHCDDCDVFIYEDPLMLTYQAGVILKTGHKWVEHAAVEPTCQFAGNIAYKQCSNCGEAWSLGENPVALGKNRWVLAPVEHTITHVAAKAATTEAEGNVEYWFCEDCGYAWLDEALTKVSNLKSVVTPKLEAEKEEAKPEQKPEADNDKTGDATPVVALIVMAVLAMFGLALVMVNKKKFSV